MKVRERETVCVYVFVDALIVSNLCVFAVLDVVFFPVHVFIW